MPWLKWLPWRFLLRRVAQAHGFLDPVAVLSRLHRFSQPSEVAEPIELLRAGVVFHARGLINSRVIQHNLDWVWPYWIERQFDPMDDAFVPRAFSVTHINLTHRNWTAVGLPDFDAYPIVDPRGLLTPFFDGFSLDSWIVTDDGRRLFPSRESAIQRLDLEDGLAVNTDVTADRLHLSGRVWTEADRDSATACYMQVDATSDAPGWLVLTLRPYNPEGVSFIHSVKLASDRSAWIVDDKHKVQFDCQADRHHTSDYHAGAVSTHLRDQAEQLEQTCDVGMATAAAMFRLGASGTRRLVTRIPLAQGTRGGVTSPASWNAALSEHCRLETGNSQLRYLYDAALRTLVLHSPNDILAGPYTYKRFWFRDAALIAHALMCLGLVHRAERAIDRFPARQTSAGYFHSQEGEWDSNGQVLWAMRRFCELTGQPPKPDWHQPIERGARWIVGKRVSEDDGTRHAGLMPPGFSAEHLGPNDYYYWDDFWGIGGLQAAAALSRLMGNNSLAIEFAREATAFEQAVDRSLAAAAARLGRSAMPASPYRRLDAGAVGSLAAGYPLNIVPADDERLLDTVVFLIENCFVDGGLFHDVIHSGINPYLTLHVAQVLLRAGDRRCIDVAQTVADLASPTGQWPEAVHPRTRGGCMGDGQHVWAAAEWGMYVRNCLVREEDDKLVLGAGLSASWFGDRTVLRFGPAPTSFGPITIEARLLGDRIAIHADGEWRDAPPVIEFGLPDDANSDQTETAREPA